MRSRCPVGCRGQAGLTLIELMLSLTLGMSLVLATAGLFVAQKSLYATYSEAAQLEENARLATGLLRQAIQQAGYRDWGAGPAMDRAMLLDLSPDVMGLDARGQGSAPGLERNMTATVNHSDVLALRFSGSGAGGVADGSMTDCSGRALPLPVDLESDRGWSIFHVAVGSAGEPELYCKSRGQSGWQSQPLVTGVEALQCLYGVDLDGDGLADRYLNANGIDALDSAEGVVDAGSSDVAGMKLYRQRTRWKNVVGIRVALVLRARGGNEAVHKTPLQLFGQLYAGQSGAGDAGTTLDMATMTPQLQRRLRKLVVLTMPVLNRSVSEPV